MRRAAVLQDLLETSRPMPVDATVDAVVTHQAAESRRKALATDIGALWLGEAGLQRERETRAALQELQQAWNVAGMELAVMRQIGEPINTGDATRRPVKRGDWIYVPATAEADDFRQNRVRRGLATTPDAVQEISLRADVPPDLLADMRAA